MRASSPSQQTNSKAQHYLLGGDGRYWPNAASRPARPRFRDATDSGHSGYIRVDPLRCGMAKLQQRTRGDGFLDHHTDALAAIGRAVLDQHYDMIADRIATHALATGTAKPAGAHTPPAPPMDPA